MSSSTYNGTNAHDCCMSSILSVSDAVDSIPANEFAKCDSIVSLLFSDKSECLTIGLSAFEECSRLEQIVFPLKLKTISTFSFYQCTALRSITLPSSLEKLGVASFDRCTLLETVLLPDDTNLTSIPVSCFSSTNITSFHIPKQIAQLDEMFVASPSLVEITIDELNPNYSIRDGFVVGKNADTTINRALTGVRDTYIVPSWAEILGPSSFRNCMAATIEFENGSNIYRVGSLAFGYAYGLKKLVFPENSNITFESNAIANSNLLQVVVFPKAATLVGNTITQCSVLSRVTLPNVTSLPNNVFNNCQSLTQLVLPAAVTALGESSLPQSITELAIRGECTDSVMACVRGLTNLRVLEINCGITVDGLPGVYIQQRCYTTRRSWLFSCVFILGNFMLCE